jgi:hypothetical protein
MKVINVDASLYLDVHANNSICSPFRLIQISGTCYINAIINTLFIPIETRNCLIEMYHQIKLKPLQKKPRVLSRMFHNISSYFKRKEDPYQLSYYSIAKGCGSIDQLFYSLVYRKLILNEPIPKNLDIMRNFGRLIQEYYCKFYKNNDLYKNSLRECKKEIYSCDGGFIDLTMITLEKHMYDEYNKIKITYDSRIFNFIPVMTIIHEITNQHMKLVSICLIILFENTAHAIMGYVCDNIPYLFDSNNFIFQDDWINGKIDNYKKFFMIDRNVEEIKINCEYLVYVEYDPIENPIENPIADGTQQTNQTYKIGGPNIPPRKENEDFSS